MSDLTDRQNGLTTEVTRADVKERVTGIVYNTSEAADGDILVYNSTNADYDVITMDTTGLYYYGGTDLPVADGGTGASTASAARTNLGIGSLATQDSDSVSITGGSISGITLSSSSAAITGGTITGITDITVADGGTGVSTLTGIAKGNGTSAWSAATANTDYSFPTGTDIVVVDGGTEVSSFTAYTPIAGGTTSTGALQSIADIGTSGQYLTSNGASALPTFQDFTGNAEGRIEFISSQTASSSAYIEFTGLSSDYDSYLILGHNILTPTSNRKLLVQCGTGAGPTYITSGYSWIIRAHVNGVGGATTTGSASDTSIRLNYLGLDNTSGGHVNFSCLLSSPSNSTVYKSIKFRCGTKTYIPNFYSEYGTGVVHTTTAVTAIKFYFESSTNISSGVFALYGIKS